MNNGTHAGKNIGLNQPKDEYGNPDNGKPFDADKKDQTKLQTETSSTNRIRHQMSERVAEFAAVGPGAIDRRLAELDREWDLDRLITVGSSAVVLAGLTAGRRFLAGAAGGVLLLHTLGIRGPWAAFRRMGYRTVTEIAEERTALKLLRGDFHGLIQMTTAEDRTDLPRWEGEGGSSTGAEAENAEEKHDRQDKGAVTDALRAARG